MALEYIAKTRPAYAFVSQGTALGTSSIIDTSAWNTMSIMAVHGGTGGSRTINVYANAGTVAGTSATAFPDGLLLGSANSAFGLVGTYLWNVGSLTDQTLLTVGTSSNASFSVSYVLFD